MPQVWNPRGLLQFGRLVRDKRARGLAVPHLFVRDLAQVNFIRLKEKGFSGIVFDKDNTLTSPYAKEIHPRIQKALEDAKKSFGGGLAIFSNSAGSSDDPGFAKARQLQLLLNIDIIEHGTKKPDGIEQVQAHFGCSASNLVFVGDRFFTDIVFGNMNGMLTIHTRPLEPSLDPSFVKILRPLEHHVIQSWIRAGASPPVHARYAPDLVLPESNG